MASSTWKERLRRLQSDQEELKYLGLYANCGRVVASIGPGGIEMRYQRRAKIHTSMLQSDQEELKLYYDPAKADHPRSFNRTRRN